jgi:hypothetical protein
MRSLWQDMQETDRHVETRERSCREWGTRTSDGRTGAIANNQRVLPRVIWLDLGSTEHCVIGSNLVLYFFYFSGDSSPTASLFFLKMMKSGKRWEREKRFTVNSVATFRVCVRYDWTLGADFLV